MRCVCRHPRGWHHGGCDACKCPQYRPKDQAEAILAQQADDARRYLAGELTKHRGPRPWAGIPFVENREAPVDLVFEVRLRTTSTPENRPRVIERFETELHLQFGSAIQIQLIGTIDPNDSEAGSRNAIKNDLASPPQGASPHASTDSEGSAR